MKPVLISTIQLLNHSKLLLSSLPTSNSPWQSLLSYIKKKQKNKVQIGVSAVVRWHARSMLTIYQFTLLEYYTQHLTAKGKSTISLFDQQESCAAAASLRITILKQHLLPSLAELKCSFVQTASMKMYGITKITV